MIINLTFKLTYRAGGRGGGRGSGGLGGAGRGFVLGQPRRPQQETAGHHSHHHTAAARHRNTAALRYCFPHLYNCHHHFGTENDLADSGQFTDVRSTDLLRPDVMRQNCRNTVTL